MFQDQGSAIGKAFVAASSHHRLLISDYRPRQLDNLDGVATLDGKFAAAQAAAQQRTERHRKMRTTNLAKLAAGAALIVVSSAVASISVAQAPPPRQAALLAPTIPPSHVVDLMTVPGATALGAQWRVSDVKIFYTEANGSVLPLRQLKVRSSTTTDRRDAISASCADVLARLLRSGRLGSSSVPRTAGGDAPPQRFASRSSGSVPCVEWMFRNRTSKPRST